MKQGLRIEGANVPFVADEEGWCGPSATGLGIMDVLAYALRVTARQEISCERLNVETNLSRVTQQVLILKLLLVYEKQVVHLPETILRSCSLCCLSRH